MLELYQDDQPRYNWRILRNCTVKITTVVDTREAQS